MKKKHRWRRRKRQPQPNWQPWLAAAVPALLAAALLFSWANRLLLPVLETAARDQVSNLVTAVIQRAADDCLSDESAAYGDFVQLEMGPDGRVAALTSDTAVSTRFRRQLTDAVLAELETLEASPISIPLGTLTGQPLLSGKGPRVKVRFSGAGTVSAEYANSFTAAGVNQTRHQVVLQLTVDLALFLPGEILPVSVSAGIPVAETVIVGEPPDTYLDMQQGSFTNGTDWNGSDVPGSGAPAGGQRAGEGTDPEASRYPE